MTDDMKDIMYKERKTVEELYSETKNVLNKADEKLEEATKKMDNYFQHIVSEVRNEPTKLFLKTYETKGR